MSYHTIYGYDVHIARKADKVRLSPLTKLGQFERSDLPAVQKGKGGRDLEGRRGAKARAFGHGAADEQSFRLDRVTGADELLCHADHVVDPIVRGCELWQLRHGPCAQRALFLGIDVQVAVL